MGKTTISNIDRVLGILNKLRPSIEEIERAVLIIKRYHLLLSQPKLLFSYKKDWIALLIAFRLFNSYKTSDHLDVDYTKSTIKTIKAYDESLAEDVSKLLPITKDENTLFADLIGAYRQSTLSSVQYFISYISTHVMELITIAKSVKDENLSKKLVALFSTISAHEVKFLIMYRDDCDRWGNVHYVVNYSIEFFIRRLNLYLKGGFEDNTKFTGIYKDFQDSKLTSELLSNNDVRNLWRFNEQLNYLRVLIGLCKKSEESGEWEGFYGKNGFWTDFDRYANTFKTKYGNNEFAEILRAMKKKIAENPEGWGGVWKRSELQDTGLLNDKRGIYIILEGVVYVLIKDGQLPQLLRRLQNPAHQRTNIIIPASLEIQKILKARGDELIRNRENAVNELIRILLELEGIGLDKRKAVKKFERFLEKRKWKLAKQVKNDANELISKAVNPLISYDEFSRQQKIVMAKVDLDFMAGRMIKLANIAKSNSRYVSIKLKTDEILRNLSELVRTDGASGVREEASSEIIKMMRYEHVGEEDFQEMEKSIPKAKGVVFVLMNLINNYIKHKIENEYTIKIQDIEKLPLNVVQQKQKTFIPITIRSLSKSFESEITKKAA